MVIQDASKQVCSSAIKWAIHGLLLKPGDMIVLLGVLHQVTDPTKPESVKGTRKLLGYRKKVDSSSKVAANHRIVDKEAARKEFENNAEILEISKVCKAEKVEFRVEVTSGTSPALVAMQSAQNMKPTWVILDRKMKKNKKIFMEKLSCGVSRMKKNNGIKLLRGPTTKFCATYNDMMPGFLDEDDLFSIELFPTASRNEICSSNIQLYTGGSDANKVSQNQRLVNTSSSSNTRLQAEETLENPGCSICDRRIHITEWRKDFTYVELHAATDGFSSKNNLSQRGFERTFRGQLENKQAIVIKPAKNNISFQEPKEFKSEIDKLIRIRHKNLVILLGCCAEGTHRLLVYEYVCNGSLNQHLTTEGKPMPLSWTQRVKVAIGAAKGLSHLHQNNIIHKNIRSSNIFLTHGFEPLLGDFGVAEPSSTQNKIQTSKYLPPEFLENGTLSTQTDAYSFGMVLLEILTGKTAMDKVLGHKDFLTWARTLIKQRRYLELVDPRIGDSIDVFQLYRMAQLAEKCISKNPKKRLTMDKVVSNLEYITGSKASSLDEDHSPLKSKFTHNCVKTMEHENCYEYEDEDVTSGMKNTSFSANLWRCRSFGISSSAEVKSYKFKRAMTTGSSSQVNYGEMLN
ncbi:Geminivirus rep interacting kinase 2 [Hibiscus syriacus]|uniref:Geminivirus rep interacting kinase 2 n=1 Tax=Hibiscus syriacus TaxID=106335 RepID=A0A6A2XGZ3_HIBSY|nr:Geminivirus rep interacting kinase 2 [Hibiscus syriacus]